MDRDIPVLTLSQPYALDLAAVLKLNDFVQPRLVAAHPLDGTLRAPPQGGGSVRSRGVVAPLHLTGDARFLAESPSPPASGFGGFTAIYRARTAPLASHLPLDPFGVPLYVMRQREGRRIGWCFLWKKAVSTTG